jgi:hypothetical protein
VLNIPQQSTQSAHQKLPKRDKGNQRNANEYNVTTLLLLCLKKKKIDKNFPNDTNVIFSSQNMGKEHRKLGYLSL